MFTLIYNCDSCDLLLVSGWNTSGYNLFLFWGGGVVGNFPFTGVLTSGGVGGGVYRLLCSAGEGYGRGEAGVLWGGVGGDEAGDCGEVALR